MGQWTMRQVMCVAKGDWSRAACSRFQYLLEAVEQALPAAEDDWRDRDRQLVNVSRANRLTDHVRASSDRYVLGAGGLTRSGDRFIQTVHEGEAALARSVHWLVGHYEERHADWVLTAPRLRGLVHPSPNNDSASASHPSVEILLVRARGLASRRRLVAPGVAKDPVMQSLTAVAQSIPRPVVRTGAVTVERDP